jgi:small subunit ribosomal protein S9
MSIVATATPAATAAKHGYYWGTGRRKTAVARVRIREGTGKIEINHRAMEVYFPDILQQRAVHNPLEAGDLIGKIDCFANVKGGGIAGQAGAVMLGLARALIGMRPDLEATLRDLGYLTRDSRMVERKKYGHKKARKSFQFSKR